MLRAQLGPFGLPQHLCHHCHPQNKTKYGSVTGESVLPQKKQRQSMNTMNTICRLSSHPPPYPSNYRRRVAQARPTSPHGDAPCSTVLFWLNLEEDCVGHLLFCCFLLSFSGFSLEKDCTGGMPTGKQGFFRRRADFALRWHQGQRWQLKRNYDLQDLVWTIPCH